MDLIKMLTEQAGVDESQARGGAGLIFSKLKDQLGGGDLDQLRSLVPGMDALADEAPEAEAESSGGLMGMLGGAASKLGLENLGNLADLGAGFSKLGISTDKISGFVSVILKFIEDKGGAGAREMVEKIIKPS